MTKHKPQPMFVGSIVFKPDSCLSPEAIDRLNLMPGGVLSVKCRCQETGINPDAVPDLVLLAEQVESIFKDMASGIERSCWEEMHQKACPALAKAKEIEK